MGYISTCLWYAFVAVALLVAAVLCHFARILLIMPLFDPMRKLSGPKPRGLFQGHMGMVMNANGTPVMGDRLVKAYGKTLKIDGFGSWDQRLYTLDQRALTYILNNSNKYQKPWQSQRVIANLIGYGMLASEGPSHKIQKKVITPAFSAANLKEILPIFFSKASELQSRWDGIIESQQDEKSAGAEIDVYHWMSRAAFDIIGLAGFDYAFNAIQNEENPVYIAYKRMFNVALGQERGLLSTMISIWFPSFYKLFPTEENKAVAASHKVIYGKARELIETKREEVLKEMAHGNTGESTNKDLLSRLLKSNLSTAVSENQRLSDESLMDNINTMLFAGFDTTSLALAWTLFLLAIHPDQQESLREELIALQNSVADPSDPSIFSTLDELPKLENVLRESLRLIPPVHSSLRVAMEDDIIPTAEPVRMRGGIMSSDGVRVKKGTFVHVALEGMNMLRDVWGEDAPDFRPERRDNLSDAVKQNPGVYVGTMTFSHGPRACIGVRFSVMLMKVFMYFMITSYRFEPVVRISKENAVLVRPHPNGEWQKQSKLPLRVTRIHT